MIPTTSSPRPSPSGFASRQAFSLVELLAVVAILGVLVGLLLPAVQRVREAARRTTCGNNVRQAALAVTGYESAKRRFPAGCDQRPVEPALPAGTLHAWSSLILPFLEETATAMRIDYARPWNAPGGNDAAAKARIAAYVCPAALLANVGKADYGGVSGAWMFGVEGVPFLGPKGLTNGMLVPIDGSTGPVTAATATDGLGHTLLVAESIDRGPAPGPTDDDDPAGRWATQNCFSQASAFVNADASDIRGLHHGGAEAAFADGRVAFLSELMDPAVLAAICTRNGGELAAGAAAVP